MSIHEPAAAPWPGRMLAILRIAAGLTFLSSGTRNVLGFPTPPAQMPPFTPMSRTGIGGVIELVGGTLFVIGLFTRPVAFVLAGTMAVACFQFHNPASFFPTVNGGIPPLLYCFILLYCIAAGAGPWSVDDAIARSRGGAHVPAHGNAGGARSS